jgi:hypothetical protein
MGEIAELVILGFLCESCGVVIDEEVTGFPRHCEDCDQ